jgi:hypothetical protein
MNDDFLTEAREEPRPEFARALREKLRAQEAEEAQSARPSFGWRWRLASAGMAAALAGIALLAVPSVRVAAQSLLDVFRVKRVAAVPTDFKRLDRLSENLDMKTFLGEQVETLVDPGNTQTLDSVEAAAGASGLEVKLPKAVPNGFTGPTVRYRPAGTYRVTADMNKVQTILDTLEIDDVEVPWEANGAVFVVKAPPVVELVYRRGDSEIVFVQSQSPEVELPPGVDLRRLGEIGLRVQGLSAAEARSFARTIDWSSTLVVPVPVMGSEYHEVDLRGGKGLLVTMQHARRPDGTRVTQGPRRSALIWTTNDRVFRLTGRGNGVDLLQMAHSIR